jgi:hypothetical protein
MARPFLETLRELRAGQTLDELADELQCLVAAVRATGKPGELTLKLKVKPPKKSTSEYLTIEDSVTTKTPRLEREDTLFFTTADNNLTRRNPRQPDLPLQGYVDTETGEVIAAGT